MSTFIAGLFLSHDNLDEIKSQEEEIKCFSFIWRQTPMHKIYLSIPNVFTVRRAFIYFLRLVDNIQSIVSATAPCIKEKELDFPRKGAPGNKSHAQINLLYLPIFCYLFASFFSLDSTLQQCRPHICHRITDYIRGEKSVMWRNFKFL